MVSRRGLEPRLPRPKHSVLPLDEREVAKVVGFEPTITVLETVALGQTKLHRRDGGVSHRFKQVVAKCRSCASFILNGRQCQLATPTISVYRGCGAAALP